MSYTIAGTVYPWDVSGILTTAKLTVISGYQNITSIILPNTVTEIANNAFYIPSPLTYYCPSLNSITMPGVTTIGQFAFYNYTSLTDVSMSNVITINTQAFNGCSNITVVNLSMPKLNATGTYSFHKCGKIQNITAPELTSIGAYGFLMCSGLITISMPKINAIGGRGFCGCKNLQLTSVSATTIGEFAFEECAITNIDLPNMITLQNNLFRSCANLQSVYMPKFAGGIPNAAFISCSKLINVPDASRATSVGEYAFYGCSKLPSIQLSLATSIGLGAFQSDASLSSVYMPKIITLSSTAFHGCSSLKNLHINSGVNITTDPSGVFGSSKLNDFFITTDNASILSAKLNALTTNTSNITASRIRMEYNPVSKSAAGDMVLTHSPAINATQYGELLTTFAGAEPTTGIHKTIYDNLNGIKTGLLLNAYNANSQLDAYYSDISFNLAPHYKNFNTYINTTSTFIPGATTQPDTTELIMTFTEGTFSKKLVYKLNK